MKVAIVADSASNIYYEDIDLTGIYRLPLQITDGERVYLEGENTSNEEIYDLVAQHHVLKTSLPPLGRIESLFAQLKDEGYDLIFAVPITEGLSSTIPAMVAAARHIDIAFDYIDCYATYAIQLNLVKAARIMFDKGFDVTKVKERLMASIKQSVTFVIPEDLMHLARGGRLTTLAARLAGVLKICPVLYLNEETGGKIDQFGKTRTMTRAFANVVEYYKQRGVGAGYKVYIAHVRNLMGAEKLKAMMMESLDNVEYFISELITTVGVHTGIGCVATQFIKEVNVD